jgi:hypothetical protein
VDFNSALGYKEPLFSFDPFFWFFFASSSLFFFPSTLTPHHELLTLSTMPLTDELTKGLRKTWGNLAILF